MDNTEKYQIEPIPGRICFTEIIFCTIYKILESKVKLGMSQPLYMTATFQKKLLFNYINEITLYSHFILG